MTWKDFGRDIYHRMLSPGPSELICPDKIPPNPQQITTTTQYNFILDFLTFATYFDGVESHVAYCVLGWYIISKPKKHHSPRKKHPDSIILYKVGRFSYCYKVIEVAYGLNTRLLLKFGWDVVKIWDNEQCICQEYNMNNKMKLYYIPHKHLFHLTYMLFVYSLNHR